MAELKEHVIKGALSTLREFLNYADDNVLKMAVKSHPDFRRKKEDAGKAVKKLEEIFDANEPKPVREGCTSPAILLADKYPGCEDEFTLQEHYPFSQPGPEPTETQPPSDDAPRE